MPKVGPHVGTWLCNHAFENTGIAQGRNMHNLFAIHVKCTTAFLFDEHEHRIYMYGVKDVH